ncbi:MAG TPA: DMT family transporter [Alphaproteobacteria bacterium]
MLASGAASAYNRAMPPDARDSAAPVGAGRWTGPALVVLAAGGFAIQTTLARLAYEHGANVITLLAVRGVVAVVVLYVVFRLMGRSLALPRRLRLIATGVGLITAVQAIGVLGAVDFIPVSLTVLIFYTYPVLVTLAARFTEGARLTPLKIGASVAAFVGIALAVNVSFETLDPRGIALAVAAALALGSTTLIGARVLRDGDSLAIVWQFIVTSTIIFCLLVPVLGGVALPTGTVGWAAFIGSAFGFVFGAVLFYSMLARIGAQRVAMFMNSEPVLTVVLAVIILGETLTPVQFLGGLLVVGAIVLVRRPG